MCTNPTRRLAERRIKLFCAAAQVETGNPYMLYKDACNRKSNQQNLGTIKCSNLCTEIVEFTSAEESAVCNLASIALPRFVRERSAAGRERMKLVGSLNAKDRCARRPGEAECLAQRCTAWSCASMGGDQLAHILWNSYAYGLTCRAEQGQRSMKVTMQLVSTDCSVSVSFNEPLRAWIGRRACNAARAQVLRV